VIDNRGKASDLLSASTAGGRSWAKAQAFPDVWAQLINLQVDGHPFTFEGRPYLHGIIRDHAPNRVIKKSAQGGATVINLTTALFWWSMWKWNVMYLLPVKAGTIPFSQGRVEPMINTSEWLKQQIVSVDNINHKFNGKTNFYVRGTNIETELREVPVDGMVFDEYDKMRMKNMGLAESRMHASQHAWKLFLSTPTIPNFGIDKNWKSSDKRFWFMDCPHCGTEFTPEWEEHVKIGDDHLGRDSIIECSHCHKEITHAQMINASMESGRWQVTDEQFSDEAHGYYFNQLFSPTRTVRHLVKDWYDGQDDPEKLRELFNSSLGMAYVMEGARLTEDILDEARTGEQGLIGIGPEANEFFQTNRINIGMDVGKVMHVTGEVVDPLTGHRRKIFMETMSWEGVYRLLQRIPDFMMVMDGQPETAKGTELARAFWGRVFLARYVDTGELAQWKYPAERGDIGWVKVDRTIAIDTTNSQYMQKRVVLPRNARDLGERKGSLNYNGFYAGMMSLVRTEAPNNQGKMVAKYEKVEGPDHWHHSDVYAMLAGLFVTPGQIAPVSEQEATVVTPEDAGFEGGYDEFVLDGFDLNSLGLDGGMNY
jgi:hypothetical protein